jgi:thioredoxin-like negative regulator of GroEL
MPCRMMGTFIHSAVEGLDVSLVEINVDEDPDSAVKYEVRSIPTLVLEKDGVVLDRMVGLNNENAVRGFVEKVL